MKTDLVVLLLLLSTLSAPLQAVTSRSGTTTAPPLHDCELTDQRDLGVWDDVFVCDDQDMIILRRGVGLFSLSTKGSDNPKELATAPVLTNARIISCATTGERLWLFMESTQTSPFAIDAQSGEVSEFEIQKLRVPGNHTPGIQSHVIVPHTGSVLLMIAGGDRDTWPRDGNRPIYFWMSLKSGKVVRFPIGWDLEYFSANQRVAVFEKPQETRFQRRPLQAVDMETGDYLANPPDRRNEHFVSFNWAETRMVKPLYVRRTETGDRDHFGGISMRGTVLPFDLHLKETSYLSTAKAEDDFTGFRLRREGAADLEASPLWIVSSNQPPNPEYIAPATTGFALLKRGNCVYVTTGHGPKGASSEAFFSVYSNKSTWNVLDGVQRLPELEAQFADKDYIEDKMNVRLIDSFGSQTSIVLCLFQHVRGDMRAIAFPVRGKSMERKTWQRAVLLTSNGERYMTNLFREGQAPDLIWIHDSGRVITGNYIWQTSGSSRQRKVQLTETLLRITEIPQ